MFSVIRKLLTHSTIRIRSDILKRSHIAGRCRNNYGILHSPFIFQSLYQLRNCRFLLTDGDINTNYVLTLLIYNRIYCYCSFSCLPVSYDKFSLTFSYRNHRVYRLYSCLQRFIYRLSLQNSGRCIFHRPEFIGLYLFFSVNRPRPTRACRARP